ncbi:MAG: sensor histidine kinase [Chloroflexota bacterium]|nr:sensor histidine kinase [Chloroflexota bacterium]
MTRPAIRPFEVALAVVVAGLFVGTLILVVDARLSLVVVDDRLDLVINTAATLIAGAVAGLAWIQFREARRAASLYQSSAFVILAIVNGLFVASTVLRLDEAIGMSLAAPGQASLYMWTLARAAVAALLAAGAATALRRNGAPGRARGVIAVPAIGILLLFGILVAVQDHLPPLVAAEGLTRLAVDPRVPSLLPGVARGGLLLQAAIGVVFLTGAALYYRLYRRDRAIENAFLSIGLVVAAFSQVQFALFPAAYTSLVSTGDALRVAFYALVLLAALAAARSDIRAREVANADLQRFRDAAVAAAAYEERARLAREVHDGLAQDLFFAKLKQARLAQIPNLSRNATVLADELGVAIDSALSEARQVVMTMRVEQGRDQNSFTEVLGRLIDDFGDRVGVRAEFTTDGSLPPLSPRVQAELLRIVQEALNNVSKHADATLVRVSAAVDGGTIRLAVVDNGSGFEPGVVNGRGFGLQSMRDRAASIGARFNVESSPHDGTRVTAELAVDAEVTR